MGKVSLIRHGKPEIHDNYSIFSILSGDDIENFRVSYDTCGLSPSNSITPELNKIILDGDLFISSGLRRSMESLRLLGVDTFESDELFKEAEIPCGIGKRLKLPLFLWAIILRIIWRFGLSTNAEPFKSFKIRIKKAADVIEKKENSSKHIVVMAHGFVNNLLGKELLRRKWRSIYRMGGNSFWSVTTFEKNSEQK